MKGLEKWCVSGTKWEGMDVWAEISIRGEDNPVEGSACLEVPLFVCLSSISEEVLGW